MNKVHLEEQLWRHLREWRETMQDVCAGRADPEDAASLLKGLSSYVLIRQDLEDEKEAEELKIDIELTSMRRRVDLLVCQKDLECDRCENEIECSDLCNEIDKLENA
jgi:hypothetical protein